MGLSIEEEDTVNWTRFTMATLSFCCSLCTLFLIYHMKIRNGYFLLVSSMTVMNIIYDINFMQGTIPGYANCLAWHVLDYLGGLSFSLWSNIISYVVLYIVVKIRSLNIYENYIYFFIIAVLPPFIIGVMSLFALDRAPDDDDVWCKFDDSVTADIVRNGYYWGRIITIIFNFVVFIYISLRVRAMTKSIKPTDKAVMIVNNPVISSNIYETESNPSRNNSTNSNASSNHGNVSMISRIANGGNHSNNLTQTAAIAALVSRMKYYPLAQAISRSGSAWDQFDNYRYSTYQSSLTSAILGPSVGIMNFFIFLVS
jgi:hypothetical protein